MKPNLSTWQFAKAGVDNIFAQSFIRWLKKGHLSIRASMRNSPKMQHDSDSGEEDNWDKIVYQVNDKHEVYQP